MHKKHDSEGWSDEGNANTGRAKVLRGSYSPSSDRNHASTCGGSPSEFVSIGVHSWFIYCMVPAREGCPHGQGVLVRSREV